MTEPDRIRAHLLSALSAVLRRSDGSDPLEGLEFGPGTEVAALPLDSIIAVEFVAELEDLMGIDLPPQLLLRSVLIEDLTTTLRELAAEDADPQ
jgi:hypothetical protein